MKMAQCVASALVINALIFVGLAVAPLMTLVIGVAVGVGWVVCQILEDDDDGHGL